MVQLLRTLFTAERKKVRKHLQGTFIDSLRLHVKGGAGGNGLPRFGGIGGQGGCVYFEASESQTLKAISQKYTQKRVAAGHGKDSHNKSILGERGTDEKVIVPVGVTVIDELGKVLGNLDKEGSTCLGASGGHGGGPNNNFLGRKGQGHSITLDLKLIANVGLVGLPNAGKSTLLKAISKANPKIASYPFTTIRPNIGIIEYPDFRQISVADLPGLIEGAHANIGMGHKFLKHVERTSLLLLICDIKGFQLSMQHKLRSCLESVFILNRELELYRPDLLEKPAMLLINKLDKPNAKFDYDEIKHQLRNLKDNIQHCPAELVPSIPMHFDRILPISAKNSVEDIEKVKMAIREVLDIRAEMAGLDDHIRAIQELKEQQIERGPRIT